MAVYSMHHDYRDADRTFGTVSSTATPPSLRAGARRSGLRMLVGQELVAVGYLSVVVRTDHRRPPWAEPWSMYLFLGTQFV